MAVMALVGKFPISLMIGKKEMEFHVQDCTLTPYFPKIDDAPKLYHLSSYIGLTDENFKKYHSMLALTDKVIFLEKVITGNILSFLKGIGYHADEQIECAITEMKESREQSYKHVKFDTFDVCQQHGTARWHCSGKKRKCGLWYAFQKGTSGEI